MKHSEMKRLKPGDLIRHKGSAEALIVHANYGNHSIAVRVHYVSNETEWDRVHPDGSIKREDEA